MTLSGFLTYITNWSKNFCTNPTLSIHFENQQEIPKEFNSGLPQESPLSPILLVIYSSPTILKSISRKKLDPSTSMMTQFGRVQITRTLQQNYNKKD